MSKQHTPEGFDLYQIIRQAHATNGLSVDESAEYSQLKAALENATSFPYDEFPWQRWKEFSERRALSSLPEERPSRELMRSIQAGVEQLKEIEERLRLWPLTNANADAQNALMDSYERKRNQIEVAMSLLKTMVADENELFGPANQSASKSKPKAVEAKSHEFLDICLGKAKKDRQKNAEDLDLLVSAAKQGVGQDPTLYATACVAAYKLARHLGLVEQSTPSTKWVPLLQEQYSVVVTEGKAKYSFLNPEKRVFIDAVRAAHQAYTNRYPHKAKNQKLPDGYQ